jgi:hypothetical protein
VALGSALALLDGEQPGLSDTPVGCAYAISPANSIRAPNAVPMTMFVRTEDFIRSIHPVNATFPSERICAQGRRGGDYQILDGAQPE